MCKSISWCNTGRFGYGSHLAPNTAGIPIDKLGRERPMTEIEILKEELLLLLSKNKITEAYIMLWDSTCINKKQKQKFQDKNFRTIDLE